MLSHEQVTAWVQRYEDAWRAPGTAAARALFNDDATYRTAPYDDPVRGLDAIGALWERERDGADEQFTMTSEIVAVEGDTAVVRVEVHYAGPPLREYRDLWVLELNPDGRCQAFEEWPFWPERERVAPGAGGDPATPGTRPPSP